MSRMRLALASLLSMGLLLSGAATAQTYSRTQTITYHDNTDKWVLGQIATVTCVGSAPSGTACDGDDVISATTFDATYARPLTASAFGKLQHTLTYDTTSSVASAQRGTLKTVKDGNNHTTTLSSWKGGVPQSIVFADSTSQSATVNDFGEITSVTDENGTGYTTSYGYDAMGRLSSIAYPPGDTVAWNTTTRVFAQVASAEHGIPAGHWRLTESTGNARTVTYFDAMSRPLLVRQYDTADVAGTDGYTAIGYDTAGNPAYTGYPVATAPTSSGGQWTLPGVRTTFDVLGRPLTIKQDSELGVLTTSLDYQSGFKTRVTDPNSHATTTGYQTYDQPVTDWPVLIAQPAGTYTHIVRDAFGKPTRIRRSDSSSPTGGTLAVDRDYTYNSYQELCRVVEPETGATLLGYDAAGNLTWSSAGLTNTQACEANGTSGPVAARRVDRTYDARNRISTLAFPDANGNQAWSYTADGLPAIVATANDATTATNYYSYNKRRLLTAETLSESDYFQPWALGYGYDANGHLASLVYPSQLTVTYLPNALGQPSRVASDTQVFASNVSYYPNGAIAAFTYGNGIVHSLSQNARQLPARSQDADGATPVHDDTYAYDANGNVAAINDGVAGNRGNRTMTYDALDRLLDVTSPMYGTTGAHYTYDVLDNLSSVTAPSTAADGTHAYCYDASNRLANVKVGSCGGATVASLGYDVQGNLTSKGGTTYVFDYGNRLRTAATEGYRYDAWGRRIRSTSPAGLLFTQYTQAGQPVWVRDERTQQRRQYVYLGGSLIAERTRVIGNTTEVITYQHTDALGSPVAKTSSARTVVERSEYEPYGFLLNRPLTDGAGYTGHLSDAATGLVNMQQRYYDPMGRFLSRDAVTAYEQPLTNFNPYVYANNNPYRFIDPDGRESACFSTGKGTSCGASQPTAQDRAKFEQAAKATAELVVPGAGLAACASGGCGALGWAGAAVDVVPGGGKVAGALEKIGGALLKAMGRTEKAVSGVGEGTRVFRVFGEKNSPMGQFWTTTDPRSVSNFRDAAGLPDVNTGRFVAEGRISDMTGITTGDALPLNGNRGGLPEVNIPNAAVQVRLERVSGVNPEY